MILKPRALPMLVLAAGLALVATGCEWGKWLRLLSLKRQLAQVERYVRVEDQGGLTIHFLKPVVYDDDLKLLIDGETSRSTNAQKQVSWIWTYEKQLPAPGTETGDYGMSFAIGFEKEKFSELRFPERFLTLMPKPLVIGLLRSAGQAQVDMRHGTVKFKWVGPATNEPVALPTKSQIASLLGAPFATTESNNTRIVLYKYYQKVAAPCSLAERLAWARFTFDESTDQVLSSQGVLGNFSWSLTRVPGDPDPRITLSLVGLSVEPVAMKLPPESADDCVGEYQDPGGMRFWFGRDGGVYVGSWQDEKHGGWGIALPELPDVFFGLPNGEPHYTFFRDASGSVTGLVANINGPKQFKRVADHLAPAPPIIAIDPKIYPSLAGSYKGSWGGIVRFTCEGERLYWHSHGIDACLPFYPASTSNFFSKAVDCPITFERNENGEVSRFLLQFGGKTVPAVKQKTR